MPILLIVDLGTPSRFLNMLIVSKPSLAIGMNAMNVGPLHLKPFSPMSAGAWGLQVFSLCAFVCALATWFADSRGRAFPRVRLAAGLIGGLAGFFLAAYPGVLLGATARPLFVNAHWLGALFLAVGAATGGAAIVLALAWLRGSAADDAIARVMRITIVALVIEVVALMLLVISVRSAGSVGINAALMQLFSGTYSLPFWLGAIALGAVLPVLLQFGLVGRSISKRTALAAALVLVRRLHRQVRPDWRWTERRGRMTTTASEWSELLQRRPSFREALEPLGRIVETWRIWPADACSALQCDAGRAQQLWAARRATPSAGRFHRLRPRTSNRSCFRRWICWPASKTPATFIDAWDRREIGPAVVAARQWPTLVDPNFRRGRVSRRRRSVFLPYPDCAPR